MTGLTAIERAERLKISLRAAPQRLLIGGKRSDAVSGRTFDTINPATGEVLAAVAHGAAADIELAVAARAKPSRIAPGGA